MQFPAAAATKLALTTCAITLILAAPIMAQEDPAKPRAEVRLWTGEVVAEAQNVDAEKRTLRPVTIVAARNGTFSGKVVAESADAIIGLKASISALSYEGKSLPADGVKLAYAARWESDKGRFPRSIDILLDSPPEKVGTFDKGPALAPVWIKVAVPRDAAPGVYTGELTVEADGLAATKVPVKVDVQNWTLPDTQDYRTWLDLIQSPDTLALEYNVALWSDKHWDLIARSFRLIGQTGSRTLYIPLICRTNFGNEESMVRWTPKGDGKYECDFSIMDKYVDVAMKNMGQPKIVVFLAWDICQSEKSLTRSIWGGETGAATREGREELLGKGPRVTSLGPATGKTDTIFLPRYADPASKAIWTPVWSTIRQHMTERGLQDKMMLGVLSDLWPSKETVTVLADITGGLPWVSHAHAGKLSDTGVGNKILYGVADLAYAAHVYSLTYEVNPEKGRLYGWRRPALVAHFPRGGAPNGASFVGIRHYAEFNITGEQRGVGRVGADIWPVVRDKRGERVGVVYSRYPENNWRNLDIASWTLAPGPDGPVTTARLENLREGVQECEARIFIESALLDPAKRKLVGDDLAARCTKAIDERQHAMWKLVWNDEDDLALIGTAASGRNPTEGFWHALAKAGKKLPGYWDGAARRMRSDQAAAGHQWWFNSDWQDRDRALFALAGEVAAKINAN